MEHGIEAGQGRSATEKEEGRKGTQTITKNKKQKRGLIKKTARKISLN